MKALIKIILKSDLCASSGYSYSGMIDSDVSYDGDGFPYIPARRLKGCLRSSAELLKGTLISDKDINEIFGESKSGNSTSIRLSNAILENVNEIKGDLRIIKSKDNELKEYINEQKVLDLFTSIRAQTRLEQGIAKDNSLRYTRIVNQTNLLTGSDNVFLAEVEYDESYKEKLEAITKATKSMGLNRNRGLGSIKCELVDYSKLNDKPTCDVERDKEVIYYTLINTEKMMISGNNNDVSLSYIPGRNMLGALASAYLRTEGNSAESEEFKDLFLRGKVIFSDIFISQEGNRRVPVPRLIGKRKKTKELVNVLDKDLKNESGNQPKKLKTQYSCLNDGRISEPEEVAMEIVYHNRRKAAELDRLLYTQEVISENQEFTGFIECPKESCDLLVKLLEENSFYFGKSKTAQYGKCKITNIKTKDKEGSLTCSKGETVVVCFLSDGIFENENDYTVQFDEVKEIIANELGIKYEDDDTQSYVFSTIINGYQGIWNMPRPSIPAISRRSVFSYKLSEDATIDKRFIGKRNFDGYGEIIVLKMSDYKEIKIDNSSVDTSTNNHEVNESAKKIIAKVLLDEYKKELIKVALEESKNTAIKRLSASNIGRVSLMVAEALNSDGNKMEDYQRRVDSIKGDYKDYVNNFNEAMRIENLKKSIDPKLSALLEANKGYVDEGVLKDVEKNYLLEIIQNVLVQQKYAKKGE